MLGNKFKLKLENNQLCVENLTNSYLTNCLVRLTDIFSNDLVYTETTFEPYEAKEFGLNYNNFTGHTIDEVLEFKLYSEHKLIFEESINDKSKCYIVFSNEKFEGLVEQLIIGLNRYSKTKVYHYSINYNSKLEYSNLENIKFNVDGDMNDGQFMQFIKPKIFLDILERGFKNVVFLDADIQIKSNIDDVFNYVTKIDHGPIFQKAAWEYTSVNGMYVPGPLLREALDLPDQKYPQCITNIVIFNQSHKELFTEWESICFSEQINKIRKEEFLHDELILNCLMWKRSVKPKQFYFLPNVLNLDDVKFFYNYKEDGYQKVVDMNNFGKGHFSQSFIYYDKSSVIGFHCIKDINIAKEVNEFILNRDNPNFENSILSFYDKIKKIDNVVNNGYEDVSILNHFISGAYMEIKSGLDKTFRVEFWNSKGNLEYVTNIGSNMWTRTSKKYFEDWTCKVYDGDTLIYEKKYDATGKRVFITLESKSIGDTLAWFPYVEEFRKKWDCQVVCSTFWNNLFVENYPEIEFVEPGSVVNNIYAMYNIGWFYNGDEIQLDKNPRNFRDLPLGQTAADILGLDFEYVKAKLTIPNVEKKMRVGIAIHSTAQSKYWNNPTGWQEVTDFLKGCGYEVMILSKEGDNYMGNKHPDGSTKLPEGSFEKLMETLATCQFFIGIGSGLSWLSWTMNIPTVLISGFSKPISEFGGEGVIRIFNDSVCNGCYNRYKLDAGDWNWCPDQKGTERQFECTKSITGKMVIDKIMNSGLIRIPNLDEDVLPHFNF